MRGPTVRLYLCSTPPWDEGSKKRVEMGVNRIYMSNLSQCLISQKKAEHKWEKFQERSIKLRWSYW